MEVNFAELIQDEQPPEVADEVAAEEEAAEWPQRQTTPGDGGANGSVEGNSTRKPNSRQESSDEIDEEEKAKVTNSQLVEQLLRDVPTYRVENTDVIHISSLTLGIAINYLSGGIRWQLMTTTGVQEGHIGHAPYEYHRLLLLRILRPVSLSGRELA